jgi:serine protease
VQLTVTDSAGVASSQTVTITVNAAAAPQPQLLASASVLPAGGRLQLDGSGSTAASGLSVVAWQWTITQGSSLAHFSSATNASTATLATDPAGSGTVTVQLTVTDSQGLQASTRSSVVVTAQAPTASISLAAASVTAGTRVLLDGSASLAPSGRTLAGYQWAVTSGGGLASFVGATDDATATLATSAAGSVTVKLTVTDSAGVQASQTARLAVTPSGTSTASAAGGSADSGGGSSGGGGGALGWGWLAGLALAVLALARWAPTAPIDPTPTTGSRRRAIMSGQRKTPVG